MLLSLAVDYYLAHASRSTCTQLGWPPSLRLVILRFIEFITKQDSRDGRGLGYSHPPQGCAYFISVVRFVFGSLAAG